MAAKLHDDHDLVYVETGIRLEHKARISDDGDVLVDYGAVPEKDYMGLADSFVYCKTCDIPIGAGVHGLSEDWQVRGDTAPEPSGAHLEKSDYRASFSPEAWVHDYSVSVDPEGPSTWVISKDHIATSGKDMEDEDEEDWDWIRDDPAAPRWVQEWIGPFSISVYRMEPDDD